MKTEIKRGFEAFLDKKITGVDSSCINVVKFETEDGEIIEINCDEMHYGIGVIQVSESD